MEELEDFQLQLSPNSHLKRLRARQHLVPIPKLSSSGPHNHCKSKSRPLACSANGSKRHTSSPAEASTEPNLGSSAPTRYNHAMSSGAEMAASSGGKHLQCAPPPHLMPPQSSIMANLLRNNVVTATRSDYGASLLNESYPGARRRTYSNSEPSSSKPISRNSRIRHASQRGGHGILLRMGSLESEQAGGGGPGGGGGGLSGKRPVTMLPHSPMASMLAGGISPSSAGAGGGVMFESSGEMDDALYAKFMKVRRCYDAIPVSSKMIVLEVSLPVKKALYSMVFNDIRAAPLWSSKQHEFVGILTITDFIRVLQKFYGSSKEKIKQLEEHTIEHWLDILEYSRSGRGSNLVFIRPEQTLFEASFLLCKHNIHRLPVVDTESGNVLHILTHKRLLKFLSLYINSLPRPHFVQRSIAELRLGSYHNIAFVKKSTKFIDALRLFTERRVSALPVVDDNMILIDMFAKFDVFGLATDQSYAELDAPMEDILAKRNKNVHIGDLMTCFKTESLWSVMDRLIKHSIHRLFVVEGKQRLIGVVSLSDILKAVVVYPADHESVLLPVSEMSLESSGSNLRHQGAATPAADSPRGSNVANNTSNSSTGNNYFYKRRNGGGSEGATGAEDNFLSTSLPFNSCLSAAAASNTCGPYSLTLPPMPHQRHSSSSSSSTSSPPTSCLAQPLISPRCRHLSASSGAGDSIIYPLDNVMEHDEELNMDIDLNAA